MKQRRKHSFYEACLSTASGFVISSVVVHVYFWYTNATVTSGQSFTIVGTLTVVSVVRAYVWRRIFTARTEVAEILKIKCHCGKPLDVQWLNGIISEPHFVLVADTVMCVECYDKMCEGLNAC